jgi:ligand-binding sensor domain-containing protein
MKYKLVIILLFSNMLLHAQHPYSWQLTVEDGLPSLEVYDLYEDSKGYMWIGTDKGVCKYNGTTFSYYQNKEDLSEALSGIQEDPEGRIWVRNFKDQIFYVENDSLHYFEMPQKINIQDFLVDTEGSIWIIDKTKDSLYCYTDSGRWKSWEVYPAETTFRGHGLTSIVEGKDHSIYLASKCGLFEYRADSIRFITAKNLLQVALDSATLMPLFLFKDKENTLFLLQNRKGYAYQVSQLIDDQIGIVWNFYRKTFQESKNHGLRVDENNTIWQLTLDAGLGPILNSSATSKLDSTLLLFPNGLLFPNEGISDFVIDREGSYWVSSLSKGVHVVPSLKIQQYTAANSVLKYDRVGLIEKKDKETLFIDTEQGTIFSYNINENVIKNSIEVSRGKCNQLAWDKEMLLVNGLMYQEFYSLLPKSSLKYEYDMLINTIRNSFIYKRKWLINLKPTGVSVYSLTKRIGSEKIPKGIFSYLSLIQETKNKLEVIGKKLTEISSFYGISDADNDRVLIARDDSLMCYPEKAFPFAILDAEGKSIRGIYMERSADGLIWICTVNSGLYALNEDLKVVDHFTSKDGLINNKIKKLKIDGDNLWLLSTHGVQCFNPKTKESHLYTTQDGLPTHEIKDIAIVNQKVWLSTAKGLVSFDTNMPSQNKVAPLVYIKNISIHDKDTVLSDFYNLSYEQNNITIDVEGLAYRSRGTLQYKYRMLGIDTVWRYQEAQTNFMRFPQLQSGEYTFEIKAVNEDGVESLVAAKVVFYIGLPYWKTWWFILIIIIFIGLIVLMVVRNQLSQARLESQNSNLKMEALQSQMNPHFIFNVLTAVQNLWLQHKNELAMDLQSNFAKLLRKIFQYSSKRAISIEQVEEFLNNYLSLEQIRFENTVDIDFQIEEILLDEEHRIPPLLIQPIIENSFKHGLFHKQKDLKLSIHLKQEGAYLYCCVEDNGVGRKNNGNKTGPKRSSGLSTTKERLFILQESTIKKKHPHNNLRIIDLKNSEGVPLGTKVEIWIPFI